MPYDDAPRYLSWHNLPPRLTPVRPLLWWLVLERFDAPDWLFVVIIGVSVAFYVSEIVRLLAGGSVDMLDDDWHAVWSDRPR